jgi:hypothetical protein
VDFFGFTRGKQWISSDLQGENSGFFWILNPKKSRKIRKNPKKSEKISYGF